MYVHEYVYAYEYEYVTVIVNHDDAFHWFIVSHINDLLKWAPNLTTED